MIYAIIALIAWNILITYRLWKLYVTVNSIDVRLQVNVHKHKSSQHSHKHPQ